jgi:hypothetical protein
MTDETIDPDRDEQMFQERLTGTSIRTIARRFRVSEGEVRNAIGRVCAPVNEQLRKHTLEIELERMDDLLRPFYLEARDGNVAAAAICVKISERRARFLGIDAPVQVDPVALTAAATPAQTSTDRIRAALDRIAAMKDGNGHDEDSQLQPGK